MICHIKKMVKVTKGHTFSRLAVVNIQMCEARKSTSDKSWKDLFLVWSPSQNCANKYDSQKDWKSKHMQGGKNEAEWLLTNTQTYLFRFRISLQIHLFGSCLWCLRQERAWVIIQFRVTRAKGHTAPNPQSPISTFTTGHQERDPLMECGSDGFPKHTIIKTSTFIWKETHIYV